MVMRSDFIREDVELDARWKPKRRPDFRAFSLDRLAEAMMRMLRVALRLAFALGICIVAARSLKPHGGIVDCLMWLAVGAYFFRSAGR